MKKLWTFSGWYLLFVGMIHVAVGAILFSDVLADIWNAGLINSVSEEMDRNAAFWFMFVGFLFIYLGWHWQEQMRLNGRPPSKFTAAGMTVMIAAGLAIMPMSGFWLLLPLCAIMLHSAYCLGASDKT